MKYALQERMSWEEYYMGTQLVLEVRLSGTAEKGLIRMIVLITGTLGKTTKKHWKGLASVSFKRTCQVLMDQKATLSIMLLSGGCIKAIP